MTLRQKLSLPAPQWLLFGLVLIAVIAIGKLTMWIAPIIVTVAVKSIAYVVPIGWQIVLAFAAFVCAVVTLAWRLHKQRRLYEDVLSGSTVIFGAEYTVE